MHAVQTARAANDNQPLGAEFKNVPEVFLNVYAGEIFGWAAKLQQIGQHLTVNLWNRPDANVLSSDYWPAVTLRCDLSVHGTSGKMLMTIRPDTDRDVEIVRKHCEALPAIIAAQRSAAAADRDKRRGEVRWVFDGTVPDYFVKRYEGELRAWAANFKKIGTVKTILLREGGLSDLSPNAEQGAVLIGVKLSVKIDRKQGDNLEIVVRAASDQDEMLIRKHCEKMQRNGIPAGLVLVEPPRAGIPILPTIKPQ